MQAFHNKIVYHSIAYLLINFELQCEDLNGNFVCQILNAWWSNG